MNRRKPMSEKRVFAKYGTLMIDMTHQQCWFLKGECTPDDKYDYPEITIDDVPVKYVHFGIPSDDILSFHDPYANQELDINDRPLVEVRYGYDSFSVVIHNDPDNQRTYMDFRNVELLTPYDFETNRFITWEEYDKRQQEKLELDINEYKCDFDQIYFTIHKFGLTKSGKNMPNPAIIRNEDGLETIDFRFLVRWHTLNPETQEPDTWAVYEDLKVLVFSDESRMNIWISRTGKHIKDQPMYRWFINFDKDGNITDMTTPWHGDDYLEGGRPCSKLINLIYELYKRH